MFTIAGHDVFAVRRNAKHFTWHIELVETIIVRLESKVNYRIDQFTGIGPPNFDVILFVTGENLSIIFQNSQMTDRGWMFLFIEMSASIVCGHARLTVNSVTVSPISLS
jgi:hypothetical protein